jgi:N-acetylmuramoyl-L-alanine amidase
MMLTQLADVARKSGLAVIEQPGWKTAGRPGGMIDVRTIVCHHTANGGAKGNAPSLNTVLKGRSDLPGPLAHFLLAVDGTVHVIAAGKCNHAGVSLKTDYSNSHAIGIEAEAKGVPGTATDWPAKQMDAYHRLCAALVAEFELDVADVRGHKETCKPVGRKSDPDFDMKAFRAAVAAVDLKPKDDDMNWSDKIALTAADARIWGINSDTGKPYKEGDQVTLGLMIRYPTLARKLESKVDELTKALAAAAAGDAARDAAHAAALNALTTDGGVTAEQVKAAAEAGALAALQRLGKLLDPVPSS